MSSINLLEYLKQPSFYGPDVDSVNVIQTHISFVGLTGKYAYKVKKPVNFGFLDFSTLEKRKFFCDEELRLNKRLCPDIYLDVIPITKINDTIELDGNGEIIDYAVKMKEFSQNKIMTSLLKKELISEKIIEKIVDILIKFYSSIKQDKEIDKYGSLISIKQNTDENFEQTKSVVNNTITKENYEYLESVTEKFFQSREQVFNNRILDGRILECHGDLHSGNIVVSDSDIFIFDCIEFNKRFRFCDVASDIGFLAMDLDYLNNQYLSSFLIDNYVKKSKDKNVLNVLNFYKCYRAYVRGKVTGFKLSDPNIDKSEKNDIISTACKYFDLATYYAKLFSLDTLKDKKSLLFFVSGLTGTGKSTVARKISVDYHSYLINTDIVRKKMEGIDIFDRRHDKFDTGLYSPEKMDTIYNKVIDIAEKHLLSGKNVVLDATFTKKKYRDKAFNIGEKNNAKVLNIHCICPDNIVKKRLEDRVKKRSISDGRWEIYKEQKKKYEPIEINDSYIEIDTSNESYDYKSKIYNNILNKIIEG